MSDVCWLLDYSIIIQKHFTNNGSVETNFWVGMNRVILLQGQICCDVLLCNTLLLLHSPGGAPWPRDENQYLLRDTEGKKWRGWRCRLLFLPGSQGCPEIAELWTQGHLFGKRKTQLCVICKCYFFINSNGSSLLWALESATHCFKDLFNVGRLSLKRPVWCDRCPINT